jgi:hypothetical protein
MSLAVLVKPGVSMGRDESRNDAWEMMRRKVKVTGPRGEALN